MTYRLNRLAQLAAIGGCCSLAVWISATNAKDEEASVLVKKPAATSTEGPALPPPSNPKESTPVAKPNSTNDLFSPQPANRSAGAQQQQPNTTVKRPFMRPAEPRAPGQGKLTATDEPMPSPAKPDSQAPSAESNVRPAPPIVYDTDRDARRMYRSGQIKLVMVTQDPGDGCYYEIPLCIPACCTGDPTVSGGHGIFGRGVVEYCWPCGFRAKVKFRHMLGDVRVDYEGD